MFCSLDAIRKHFVRLVYCFHPFFGMNLPIQVLIWVDLSRSGAKRSADRFRISTNADAENVIMVHCARINGWRLPEVGGRHRSPRRCDFTASTRRRLQINFCGDLRLIVQLRNCATGAGGRRWVFIGLDLVLALVPGRPRPQAPSSHRIAGAARATPPGTGTTQDKLCKARARQGLAEI